jgi:hypothetical protein
MLGSFLDWAHQIQASENPMVIDARVTEGANSSNRSARLDIDTDTKVARITCWESGDYDAEVLDLGTERTLYSAHGVLRVGPIFGEQVAPFLEALGI